MPDFSERGNGKYPLPIYWNEESWPPIWRMPDAAFDDELDVGERISSVVDDICLREAIHVWDNSFRLVSEPTILSGMIGAALRYAVATAPGIPVEELAEMMKEATLKHAPQLVELQKRGSWFPDSGDT